MAVKAATVKRAFKARITDTHVFYAHTAHGNVTAIRAFLHAYAYPVENLNAG